MALTRIRNPFVFAASLVLLASAAWLGQGTAPADADRTPAFSFDASEVLLEGDLFDAHVPDAAAWAPVRAVLHNATLWMNGPDLPGTVLVTGLTPAAAGEDRVVRGAIVYEGPHPDDGSRGLVVVEAESVEAPGLP